MKAQTFLKFSSNLLSVTVTGASQLIALGYFGKRFRRPVVNQAQKYKPQLEMVGREGLVVKPLGQGHEGLVEVEGELWLARLPGQDGMDWPLELENGAWVRIVAQQDLLLLVEPLPAKSQGWQ